MRGFNWFVLVINDDRCDVGIERVSFFVRVIQCHSSDRSPEGRFYGCVYEISIYE